MKTERLYYVDSYLTEFSAEVVGVVDVAGRIGLTLDRTAFYPTSGGQPHDLGSLGGVAVVDVIDQDDELVHVLAAEPPATTQTTGRIDWDRRFDHMQQHTGQHLLSQAVERHCGARTVSFHLGPEVCTIDVDLPTLPAAALAAAEAAANAAVLADLPVDVRFADAADADQLGLRKATERVGQIRVIDIAGLDRSACGGTHVARTGAVGPIKVRRLERRGAETRVEFLCGWRALRDYGWKHDTVAGLAETMSVRDRDLRASVERALAQLRDARDELEQTRKQLRHYEADALAASGEPIALATGGTALLVAKLLADAGPDDLKRLAQRITGQRPAVALLGGRAAERTHFVFAQTPGLPFDMGKLLRTGLQPVGGRGGGSRDLAQGGAPGDADAAGCLRSAGDTLLTPKPG